MKILLFACLALLSCSKEPGAPELQFENGSKVCYLSDDKTCWAVLIEPVYSGQDSVDVVRIEQNGYFTDKLSTKTMKDSITCERDSL